VGKKQESEYMSNDEVPNPENEIIFIIDDVLKDGIIYYDSFVKRSKTKQQLESYMGIKRALEQANKQIVNLGIRNGLKSLKLYQKSVLDKLKLKKSSNQSFDAGLYRGYKEAIKKIEELAWPLFEGRGFTKDFQKEFESETITFDLEECRNCGRKWSAWTKDTLEYCKRCDEIVCNHCKPEDDCEWCFRSGAVERKRAEGDDGWVRSDVTANIAGYYSFIRKRPFYLEKEFTMPPYPNTLKLVVDGFFTGISYEDMGENYFNTLEFQEYRNKYVNEYTDEVLEKILERYALGKMESLYEEITVLDEDYSEEEKNNHIKYCDDYLKKQMNQYMKEWNNSWMGEYNIDSFGGEQPTFIPTYIWFYDKTREKTLYQYRIDEESRNLLRGYGRPFRAESFEAEQFQYEVMIGDVDTGIEDAEIVSLHETLEDAKVEAHKRAKMTDLPIFVTENRYDDALLLELGTDIVLTLNAESFEALDYELNRDDCCEVWVEKLYDDGKIGFGQAGNFLVSIETGDLKCSQLGSDKCNKNTESFAAEGNKMKAAILRGIQAAIREEYVYFDGKADIAATVNMILRELGQLEGDTPVEMLDVGSAPAMRIDPYDVVAAMARAANQMAKINEESMVCWDMEDMFLDGDTKRLGWGLQSIFGIHALKAKVDGEDAWRVAGYPQAIETWFMLYNSLRINLQKEIKRVKKAEREAFYQAFAQHIRDNPNVKRMIKKNSKNREKAREISKNCFPAPESKKWVPVEEGVASKAKKLSDALNPFASETFNNTNDSNNSMNGLRTRKSARFNSGDVKVLTIGVLIGAFGSLFGNFLTKKYLGPSVIVTTDDDDDDSQSDKSSMVKESDLISLSQNNRFIQTN
jgi:hypothetical protein